jgi:hypothetical protein
MMFNDIDLNAIQDKNARKLILRLLNMIEQLSAELREAKEENHRLRDEINGFRNERLTADAVEQCFKLLSRKISPEWILEGTT